MYKVKVISQFSAAHSLRKYKGKCENLHGHNWKIEVVVASDILNSLGMVMDFSDLKKIVNEVLEEFDHKYLNELDYFSPKSASSSGGKGNNPSSENIAGYLYSKVKEKILHQEYRLEEVRVWETEKACAIYCE